MNRFLKAVLLTGLFVGTTDLVSAYITQWIKTGKFAEKMLNYIAGGALGLENSIPGGNLAALLGLFFHYFISFSFTLLFFLLLPRVKFLAFNKYLIGMLYAVFVDVVMALVILPLSRLPTGPFSVAHSYVNWIVLGVLFGVPIAYNAYKYYGLDQDR
jgi:hypothetical protein